MAMDPRLSGGAEACPSPRDVLQATKEYCSSHAQAMSFSSFSPSLYDTAWLSLVPTEDRTHGYLFPQCLDLILQTQQTDGTWPCYASLTDGIIVSLGALLSIVTHRAHTIPTSDKYQALTHRIERGTAGVHRLLRSWNVGTADHVGFEVLVTSLLRQLEDKLAYEFGFPGRSKLWTLYQTKMRKFSPKLVYGSKQTTILHSIEGFIDVINFSNIAHHCTQELGIFGSPAATAAYLIHSSKWDHRAEKYLERAVASYGGQGHVPSAFPTPLFELSWTVSTMLSPIVEVPFLDDLDLGSSISFFAETLQHQGGLVGFAPGILEDADDTARCLLTLLRLRRYGFTGEVDLAPMVLAFETKQCFKTYELERNPSFSANCNVVLVMLELEPEIINEFSSQIEKALIFLLDITQHAENKVIDKWNIAFEYSFMLLIEVFVLALKRYDEGLLQTMQHETFTSRIPIALCRIITRILAAQKGDGSWDHSLEVTSYSVLALSHVLRLPWCHSIADHLTDRMRIGQSFLQTWYPKKSVEQNEYLWIEKTTFQSSLLRTAYCSMALNTKTPAERWSKSVIDIFASIGANDQKSNGMKKLFGMLPLLSKVSPAMLDLTVVEAKLHAANLASNRNSILPRSKLPLSQDKYLSYIPIIWLLANQVNDQALSAGVMEDMLKLSQLTFQIDEFMETTVAELSPAQMSFVASWIPNVCRVTVNTIHQCGSDGEYEEQTYFSGSNDSSTDESGSQDGIDPVQQSDSHLQHPNTTNMLLSVQKGLRNFIRYILRHDVVLASSPLVQQLLAVELSDYLLAHMRQNKDNAELTVQARSDTNSSPTSPPARGSYFAWARGTGADHTSCPFAFRFFTCLILASKNTDMNVRSPFDSAQAQYYASSLARHLATMCRQYNDYGSISRDAAEHNLNSVDFAEFQPPPSDNEPGSQTSAMENLMAIAEFERQLMAISFQALKKAVGDDSTETMAKLKVLVDVTDLFGQLYVAKDIASRKHLSKQAQSS